MFFLKKISEKISDLHLMKIQIYVYLYKKDYSD